MSSFDPMEAGRTSGPRNSYGYREVKLPNYAELAQQAETAVSLLRDIGDLRELTVFALNEEKSWAQQHQDAAIELVEGIAAALREVE